MRQLREQSEFRIPKLSGKQKLVLLLSNRHKKSVATQILEVQNPGLESWRELRAGSCTCGSCTAGSRSGCQAERRSQTPH